MRFQCSAIMVCPAYVCIPGLLGFCCLLHLYKILKVSAMETPPPYLSIVT